MIYCDCSCIISLDANTIDNGIDGIKVHQPETSFRDPSSRTESDRRNWARSKTLT